MRAAEVAYITFRIQTSVTEELLACALLPPYTGRQQGLPLAGKS
jgi:hypothetical protein